MASPKEPAPLNLAEYVPVVVKNVPKTGRRMAQFIKFLIDNGAADGPQSFHVLEMSLGAHVVESQDGLLSQRLA